MKIGILDSGIGGLSVLHEAYHIIPNVEYIYYADTKNVPYGLKKNDEIVACVENAINFFIRMGVDGIVIACNTATSVAVDILRQKYSVPIVGMEPAVKPAVLNTEDKRVMVIATPVTIREEKLINLVKRVDEEHRVDLLPVPELVTFAEEMEFDSYKVEEYLKNELAEYNINDYCALVMGCTHFNYFKPIYKEIFGEQIELIDGVEGTIKQLAKVVNIYVSNNRSEVVFKSIDELLSKFKTQYYRSGELVEDKDYLESLIVMHNRLEDMRKI